MSERLPAPRIWPLTVAAGCTLLGFGVLTSPARSGLGLLLMIWGLLGWIQELRHAG